MTETKQQAEASENVAAAAIKELERRGKSPGEIKAKVKAKVRKSKS